MELGFGWIEELPEREREQLKELERIFQYHYDSNRTKARYYAGRIRLNEVNLGIALPTSMSRLEIGCAWGAKTVDVLAGRSMFDGFVAENGAPAELMTRIIQRNRLVSAYIKASRDELKYGCTFAALSGERGNARVRFYSPQCAAAAWDDWAGRLDCGFAFADLRHDESDTSWKPSTVNFYTATDTWVLSRQPLRWRAERYPHSFGRPLMEPLVWDATSNKPFGQSRLKEPIRRLIQGYVRTVANATIGLEFATSPQKYLLGVTDEQYNAVTSQKFMQYVGSILTATQNPETGENPTFGQLSQGGIEPHVQMLRLLATQFSAATGLAVTDTGVVNDANPTSSDAILAQTQTLVLLAEQLNTGNAESLYHIAQMAQAIELGCTPDELPEEAINCMAHFKNPSMPSISATADAATKIAATRPNFANTDVYLEMIGFDQADIRRIKAQERRARGQQILTEELGQA